jgi:hypothetical protein
MCIPPFDIYNLTDSREIVNHIFEMSLNFFPGSVAVAAQTLEESHFSDGIFIDLTPHPSVCTVIVILIDLVYESIVTIHIELIKSV